MMHLQQELNSSGQLRCRQQRMHLQQHRQMSQGNLVDPGLGSGQVPEGHLVGQGLGSGQVVGVVGILGLPRAVVGVVRILGLPTAEPNAAVRGQRNVSMGVSAITARTVEDLAYVNMGIVALVATTVVTVRG